MEQEKEMKWFFITPLVMFLLLAVIMTTKMLLPAPKPEDVLVGKALPEFNLPAAIEGDAALSSSDLKGHYALVNIFASWCVTCKIEHGFLKKLQAEGINIYGIDWKDTSEKLKAWLSADGNPYKAIGADIDGKTIIDLGVTGAPETLLVSPDGIVLFRYAGAINEDIWNKHIKPLMR